MYIKIGIKFQFKFCYFNLYTYKTLVILLNCLLEAVRIDSEIQGYSRPVMKFGRIIVLPMNQLLRSK